MKEFKKIKQLAKAMAKVRYLAKQLSNELDTEGIVWTTAEFVNLSKDDIEKFGSRGTTEEYYVDQWEGICEDDYYGYLYFKTDVPTQYVKVYFEM